MGSKLTKNLQINNDKIWPKLQVRHNFLSPIKTVDKKEGWSSFLDGCIDWFLRICVFEQCSLNWLAAGDRCRENGRNHDVMFSTKAVSHVTIPHSLRANFYYWPATQSFSLSRMDDNEWYGCPINQDASLAMTHIILKRQKYAMRIWLLSTIKIKWAEFSHSLGHHESKLNAFSHVNTMSSRMYPVWWSTIGTLSYIWRAWKLSLWL